MSSRDRRQTEDRCFRIEKSNFIGSKWDDYFLNDEGIDREVLQTEIRFYLGGDATCRPTTHKVYQHTFKEFDGDVLRYVQCNTGYIIRSFVPLTPRIREDLEELSNAYRAERARNVRHGMNKTRAAREIPYQASETYRNKHIIIADAASLPVRERNRKTSSPRRDGTPEMFTYPSSADSALYSQQPAASNAYTSGADQRDFQPTAYPPGDYSRSEPGGKEQRHPYRSHIPSQRQSTGHRSPPHFPFPSPDTIITPPYPPYINLSPYTTTNTPPSTTASPSYTTATTQSTTSAILPSTTTPSAQPLLCPHCLLQAQEASRSPYGSTTLCSTCSAKLSSLLNDLPRDNSGYERAVVFVSGLLGMVGGALVAAKVVAGLWAFPR